MEIYGDDFVKTLWTNDAKLNTYAYFWATHNNNLRSALDASQHSSELFEHQIYYNTLANIYWKMKRYHDAIKYQKEALTLNPNFERAKKEIKQIQKEMFDELDI